MCLSALCNSDENSVIIFKSACEIFNKDESFENSSPSKASETPILFPHHLQRAEMLAPRRSDEYELGRKFLPTRFVSHVQHWLNWVLAKFCNSNFAVQTAKMDCSKSIAAIFLYKTVIAGSTGCDHLWQVYGTQPIFPQTHLPLVQWNNNNNNNELYVSCSHLLSKMGYLVHIMALAKSLWFLRFFQRSPRNRSLALESWGADNNIRAARFCSFCGETCTEAIPY